MAQIAVAKAVVDRAAIVDEAERDLRTAEDHARHRVVDERALILCLPQKRSSHGNVEEQIAHDDGRPLRAADLAHGHVPPALHVQPRSRFLRLGARGHLHAGDGSDGRQRLAAKAERANIIQLLGSDQLGGGVVLKGQTHLPRLDAAAVVSDAHIADAAVAYLHCHGGGAGVQRIFHQLFDHRRGPFDDLAGGNASDRRRVQNANGHMKLPSLSEVL